MRYTGALPVMLVIGALVLIPVVFVDINQSRERIRANKEEFRAACESVHGKTVWDGRQWSCLK